MPRSFPPKRGLLAFSLAVVSAATAACVQPKNPGVAISSLQSDIVFGIPAAVENAVPAIFSAPPDLTAAEGKADVELPQFEGPTTDTTAPRIRVPRAPIAVECPDAALNAFPDKEATTNLPANVLPALGDYRYKKKGAVKYTNLPVAVDIQGFEKRRFQNLVQVVKPNLTGTQSNLNPDGYRASFTYEQLQPTLDGRGQIKTTFRVSTAGGAVATPTGGAAYPPQGELSQSNPVTGNTVAYRDPEAGVVLKKIEYFDASGNRVNDFSPQVGLLLMPLGVREGEKWQSAAVDPARGLAYQLQGFIKERGRVDACGKIIEGWRLETTLTIADGQKSVSMPWSYVISTDLGGIMIAEDTTQVTTDAQYQLTNTIGQTTPTPVP